MGVNNGSIGSRTGSALAVHAAHADIAMHAENRQQSAELLPPDCSACQPRARVAVALQADHPGQPVLQEGETR